jgi:hypothetical protein
MTPNPSREVDELIEREINASPLSNAREAHAQRKAASAPPVWKPKEPFGESERRKWEARGPMSGLALSFAAAALLGGQAFDRFAREEDRRP